MRHKIFQKERGNRRQAAYCLSRDMCFVNRGLSKGFTVIEIVIMLAILTAIASVVLVSFPSLSENIYLQKDAQDISLLLRKAQGTAFAQGVAPLAICGFGGVPSGYGVQLKLNSPTYALFADCNNNKQWDAGETIQTSQFDNGLVISSFTDLNNAPYSGYQEADVVFTFAFANPINSMNVALISGSGIPSNTNGIKIILKMPRTGLTKSILIVNTGQVSIQ